MAHSYPSELADFLLERWRSGPGLVQEYCEGTELADALPERSVLVRILSVCYQASLLREEERPVRFRLILRPASEFPAPGGPPHGLHRLVFDEPRPLTQDELRRLAPAVDFYRGLLGCHVGEDGNPYLWGIVTSGPRWVQALHGGRQSFQRLPPDLVVRVTSPGRVAVCKGLLTVATLIGGRIVEPSLDIFDSRWLPAFFTDVRDEIMDLHRAARERASTRWANVEPGLVHAIALHAVRRVVGIIRNTHHGGTLLILPPQGADSLAGLDGHVFVKYPFAPEEPRRRFRTIVLALLNAIAGFAAADGAVVLDKRIDLLGFGAEIGSDLPAVRCVARARDAEATEKIVESVESVGQRHRSAYRLCNFAHDAVAIVVSQDGTVRFVKWHDGEVTYWANVATSVLDV